MKQILLVHGWNYRNYTSQSASKDAWNNRKDFVELLSKECKIYKLNLPGFCGEPEPKDKAWRLDDYAKFINDYIVENNLN